LLETKVNEFIRAANGVTAIEYAGPEVRACSPRDRVL
jgi:hypothetical protein